MKQKASEQVFKNVHLGDKRKMWQLYQHLQKSRDYVFDARITARKEKHFEYVQLLGLMSEDIGHALAALRTLCRKLHNVEIESLESFK